VTVGVEVEVHEDAGAAARRAAAILTERAATSGEPFALALSKAPHALLAALAEDLPWGRVTVFQVDERVAPPDTPERNLTALLDALPTERVRPMPVDDPELELAAARYAAELPASLDVVHLGLGADGHTASLVPGDPVLEADDRLVAVTGVYEGRRRMTLTYPALDAARGVVWLVIGSGKREALTRLLARDPSIPATGVRTRRQLVIADSEAAP
jgi:6-phosphogluconolactonase/glucosamine-6-phosphate isomerase/deaminase